MATINIYADTRGHSVCKSCGARIEWCEVVVSGKKMPFNDDIVATRTSHEPSTQRLIEEINLDVNTCHFATCPQSSNWRRANR